MTLQIQPLQWIGNFTLKGTQTTLTESVPQELQLQINFRTGTTQITMSGDYDFPRAQRVLRHV